jgi:hypothetical protein
VQQRAQSLIAADAARLASERPSRDSVDEEGSVRARVRELALYHLVDATLARLRGEEGAGCARREGAE